MSAIIAYHLTCDHDGCDQRFTTDSPRTGPTRSASSTAGWIHRIVPRASGGPAQSLDYCPTHAGEHT